MAASNRPMRTGKKTYWHLLEQRRMPTPYEIVSSRLAYAASRPLEITTAASQWCAERSQSRLVCEDWESFADPAQTTYASYVADAHARDLFVEQHSRDEAKCGSEAPAEWLVRSGKLLAVLRYPVHALQMTAAYLGSIAPSGRITQAALYQAADEMRRVHWFAHRIAQIRRRNEGVAADARQRWEADPAWQPLRRLIEDLLLVFAFDECFVALNLVVKPCFDELWLGRLRELATTAGDVALAGMLGSLHDDARRQQTWSRALVTLLRDERHENGDVVLACAERWLERASLAVAATAKAQGLFGEETSESEAAERAVRASKDVLGKTVKLGGAKVA